MHLRFSLGLEVFEPGCPRIGSEAVPLQRCCRGASGKAALRHVQMSLRGCSLCGFDCGCDSEYEDHFVTPRRG